MIDAKLFDELKNRGIITNPHIKAENYDSLDELYSLGYITHVTEANLEEVYGGTSTDEPTDTPTDEPTDEPTDTPTDDPVVDPTDEPVEDEIVVDEVEIDGGDAWTEEDE